MLIAFSVKCHGEGSVYYSSQSMIYVLPTFISWRYWSPESWKTPKWAFPAAQAQRADHGSHQPSCTHHREQIHEPQHLFSACPHLKANHSLCSSTSGWVGGELSQCFSPCFPAPGELLASPVCCVCGFCCLLPGFITYATSVEQNPLSSLVLGSFAGWHWRYIWTLGTVLLERQVRICQNTTVYTCRGKRKKKGGWFLFPKFLLWADGSCSSSWGLQVFRALPCLQAPLVHHPKNDPFPSPIVFVPSCPKKSAGSAMAVTHRLCH